MKRVTAYAFWAFALSLCLTGLTGCVNPAWSPTEPAITSFTANPTAVTAGGTASLTGVFTNGTGVITPGDLPAASGTAVTVTPTQTTTYILTVTNASGGTTAQTATVTVSAAAPTIASFAATPAAVTAGGTVSLTGVFANGTGVITPGNISATSGTAVSVAPTDTTIYTLTVTNSAGATTQQTATVTVNPVVPVAPTITSFTANPTSITAGGTASLTGVFANGTGVITPGNLAEISGTPVSVTPTDTTIYTLTVTNSAGVTTQQTATLAVNPVVVAAPTITSFTTNPTSITAGGTASLTGVFSGGTGVITPGNIAATSGTAVTVTPTDTTIYTLTVTNSAGVTATQAATVTVNAALIAQTITFANPGAQTEGTPLTLSATATSGLAVSFTSTTASVCTATGTTASFIAAGTCSITASQAGNGTYAAAAPVSQSFTVSGTIPPAPTGLTATAGNTAIALSWTPSTGATSYNVYRGTTAGGESTTAIATGITTTSDTDTGLTNNTTYYYKIAAVNASGISGLSNEASATPTASLGLVTITANKPAYPFQVLPGSTRQVNVQITGGTLNTVNWSVLSVTGGATATFTTPAASGVSTVSAGLATVQVNIGPTAGNCSISGSMGSYSITSAAAVTVQAQSVDDTTKSATFLFNVCAKTTTVMVAPAYQQAFKSQHRMLQSWISGDADETGTWSIATQPSGGDGTLADTANRDADFVATVTGRYTLRYTSNSNPAKSATAIVYVSPNALPSYASTPNFTEPRECYVDPALTGGDYEVGAGKKYTTVSSVPAIDTWTPGTIMRIWNTDTTGSNPSTYHEYFQIRNGGTPAQPVIVCGAPDSYGNLPILDGKNAVGQSGISTGAAAGYGIMSVWAGPPTPYGYWQSGSAGPSYVSITGLHLRNATPANSYTPPGGGTAEAYIDGASCVNLRSGSYIDVGGIDMDTCTNGLFTAENGNSEWANITQLVTVTGNHIHQSGWSTDYSEHQVYFQTWYGLMQGNKIDNYLSAAQGSNIKWRGVEGIFRYNDIASGPLRDFDLVENQDAPQYVTFEDYLGAPGDTVCDDSAYCLGDTAGANIIAAYQESAQKDFIYGNLIFGTSAEDQIHYAEDNTGGMSARNGTLYFYSNTLDNAQKIFDTGENGDGYNPILQPRVDARNNILWARTVAWSGVVQMEFGSDATIILDATTNLMQAGTFTIAIPIEGAVWQDGTQEGWPSTCDSTPCFWPLTVPLNTHLYGLSNANYLTASSLPYNATTLLPVAGSAAIEAGTPLSGLLATMPVRWQFSTATNSLTARLDPLTVGAEDYGAVGGAPPSPTGLSTTAGNASVSLNWTASIGATSYNIYRGTTSGGESTTAIATGTTTTSYTDSNVTNGTPYYYKVAAVNSAGISAMSNEASATPEASSSGVPAAPTGLQAAPGNQLVSLSWTGVPGATSYSVTRSTTNGGPYTSIGTTSGTVFEDGAVVNNTAYYYVVAAVNISGTGANSLQVSATPMALPGASSNLVATIGDGQVLLTWTAGTGAVTFAVSRATGSGGPYTQVGTSSATSYTDTGLTDGTPYYYVVYSVNPVGTSAASNQAEAIPIAAPTGLTAVATDGQVALFWTPSLGAISYNINIFSQSGCAGSATQFSSQSPRYLDTGLTDGLTYYYKVTAVNSTGSSAPSACVSATPSASSNPLPPAQDPTKNYVGLGTWFLSDWDGSSAFVDLVKQSRPWNLPNWNAGFATVDALGWPTEDASTVLASYPYFVFDTYKLVFNGKATVTPQWFTGTVTNQVYNAATNTTTADVNVTGQGDGYINLIFTNTQRTGSSATGTGFTNAHLYRPGYPTDGSVVFTTPFLTAMGKVSTIRMMDWTNTNSNYIVNWADRTTPLSATQAGLPNLPYTAPDGTVYNGNNGIALEYQILLCNTLMVDCYFNIPVVASDDFVNKMALAIAFGTDGTNPYSSPQTSAVFPPLNPSLRIYLEYANEVWNSGAGVFHPVESICEELPADHPLVTVDGNAGIWGTMWRYPAWRMATVSQTFASVFGSAAMMTRVRPLLETQQGDGQATLATALQWLNDYAPTLTPASTIPELLYGGGGSGYYGPINANSADPNVYLAPANYPDPNALLAWGIDATWTYNYGIKHVAYEGGPGLPGFTRAANDLLNADPRMETMMDAYQTVWDQQGGDVLVYYTVEGPSQWEFTPDITDSTTPKFDALADIQAAPRAAVTLGAALPGTMLQSNESQYRISSGELWDYASTVGGESCLSPSGTVAGNYFAYPAHAATAFTGTLTVSGSASSNTQLEVWINGVDQGSVSMAAESNTSVLKNSTTLKVGIPEGLSVIRMYYTSGNMTFCGLTVTNP